MYYPWIKELDDKGYPKKIELEPNQSEVVEYSFKIKTLDIQYYNFTLKASESGVENPRDTVETTFRLNNTRIEGPVFTGFRPNGFDITINAPEVITPDLRPETYELYLKFERGGRFIDPHEVFTHIQIEESNPTPELEGLNHNYMMDDKGNLYIRVTIDNVLFERTNERIRLNVFLEDKDYQVTGKIEVFDPISRQRNSFSDEVKGK